MSSFSAETEFLWTLMSGQVKTPNLRGRRNQVLQRFQAMLERHEKQMKIASNLLGWRVVVWDYISWVL